MSREEPTSFWKRILARIPGFEGYGDARQRQDSDRQTRTWLASQLAEAHAALDRSMQQAIARGDLDAVGRWERVRQQLQSLNAQLQTTGRAYQQAWDRSNVDDSRLQDLYDLEADLLDDATLLVTHLQQNAVQQPQEVSQDVEELLQRLQQLLQRRQTMLAEL